MKICPSFLVIWVTVLLGCSSQSNGGILQSVQQQISDGAFTLVANEIRNELGPMDKSSFITLFTNILALMEESSVVRRNCVLAEALLDKLNNTGLILKHQAFLLLRYSECSKVEENVPKVFDILLKGMNAETTTKYRLTNKKNHGYLYCPSDEDDEKSNEENEKNVYTWKDINDLQANQIMSIKMEGDKLRIKSKDCDFKLKQSPGGQVFWMSDDTGNRYGYLWTIEAKDMTDASLSFHIPSNENMSLAATETKKNGLGRFVSLGSAGGPETFWNLQAAEED